MISTGAVEGILDRTVLERLGRERAIEFATIYVTNGKSALLRRLRGFNRAAERSPWVVLIDLDSIECAPVLIGDALREPSALMRFRVAVRAVESWLLADAERIARFLSVSATRVPGDPDAERDPKSTVVELARHSRRRSVRDDIVPSAGGGRKVGPAYSARLIEFVLGEESGWRPDAAAERSESLRRCLDALT